MKPTEQLTSLAARKRLSGEPLLHAFRSQRTITPIRMDAAFDDSKDSRTVLLSLTGAERSGLGLGALPAPAPGTRALGESALSQMQPRFLIRIHAILCANDDGSGGAGDANAIDAPYVEQVVFTLNRLYLGARIQFVFDPSVDFEAIPSSLLNLDFTVPDGLDLATPEASPPIDEQRLERLRIAHENERQRVARKHRHTMVLLFCDGNLLKFVDPQWVLTERDFAFSGPDLDYVALPTRKGDVTSFANLLAHESGHYFHQHHTHGPLVDLPADEMRALTANWATLGSAERDAAEEEILRRLIEQAKGLMAAFVAPAILSGRSSLQGAAEIFNGDGLADTPPDPGPTLFAFLNGGADDEGCGAVGSVELSLHPSFPPVVLAPDRANPMSYFKHCTRFPMRFSAEQFWGANGIRKAVEMKNRRHLVSQFYATIYADRDFAGPYQYLGAGRYDVGQLGLANDTVSSVQVPHGWKVTLFSEAGFWGDSMVLTADRRFVGRALNDRVSSIVVERSPVTVYEHAGFQGRGQVLSAGRYDVGQLTIGNDSLSSIRVPPGWRVTLFSEAGFWGDSVALTCDTAYVGDTMNDRTSSLVVDEQLIALFESRDFQGRGQTLLAGRYDAHQLAVGNDSVGSVRVPRGWRVTLFSEAGFWGDSVVLTADTRDLGGPLKGRVSSVLAESLDRREN